MAKKAASTRTIVCAISGKKFEYLGFGRPPLFHPDVRKQRDADMRKARYRAKREGKAPSRKAA